MQEQYRKANDMIHAPEDLIRRTEAAVRQEKKRRKKYVFRRYAAVAAAACLCLVCFGIWNFSVRDRIIIQDVEISENEFSAGLNLGGHDVPGGEGEIQKIPAGDGESENQDTEKENTGSLDVRVENMIQQMRFRRRCGSLSQAGSTDRKYTSAEQMIHGTQRLRKTACTGSRKLTARQKRS